MLFLTNKRELLTQKHSLGVHQLRNIRVVKNEEVSRRVTLKKTTYFLQSQRQLIKFDASPFAALIWNPPPSHTLHFLHPDRRVTRS